MIDDDTPNTQAPAMPTAVVIVPTAWQVLGGNYSELLIQRIDMAVIDFYHRHERTGKLGMTGPQLIAMRELHEFHDLQIQSITRAEFEGWIKKTADRIRSAHPDVKVFI